MNQSVLASLRCAVGLAVCAAIAGCGSAMLKPDGGEAGGGRGGSTGAGGASGAGGATGGFSGARGGSGGLSGTGGTSATGGSGGTAGVAGTGGGIGGVAGTGVAGNGAQGGRGGTCASDSCVAKKPDGDPCSSAAECLTGVCGGRCCAAGCTCTLPSPGNVLKDPGIDVAVTNWTKNIGTISRSLSDAERCPYSGSLAATADGAQTITQCVPNTVLVGDFNFGARFRFESNGAPPDPPICQANFYSGFNCNGDLVVQNEAYTPTPAGSWQSVSSVVVGVAGANSVAMTCYLFPSTGVTYYLDMLYVSKAPAAF